MLLSSTPGYHTIVVRTFGYATTAIRIFVYDSYSILKYGAILGKGAQCTSWGRSPSDLLPLSTTLTVEKNLEDYGGPPLGFAVSAKFFDCASSPITGHRSSYSLCLCLSVFYHLSNGLTLPISFILWACQDLAPHSLTFYIAFQCKWVKSTVQMCNPNFPFKTINAMHSSIIIWFISILNCAFHTAVQTQSPGSNFAIVDK